MKIVKKISLIIIGIILSLIILEIGLQTASYINKITKNYKINKQIKNKDSITILCLGESTTDRQWPPILQKILDKKSKNKKFSVIDAGIGGSNTDELLHELINKYTDANKPDIVVSMMGINDNTPAVKHIKYINKKIKLKVLSLVILLKYHLMSLFKIDNAYANEPFNSYEQSLQKLENCTILKDYNQAVEIIMYLYKNYPKKKQEIFMASRFVLKSLEVRQIIEQMIKDIIKENPYFEPFEVIEIFCQTKNTKILKEIYPPDDKIFLKKLIKNNFGGFFKMRELLSKFDDMKYLVKEIDNVIYSTKDGDLKNIYADILGFRALNCFVNQDYKKAEELFNYQTKYILNNIPINTSKNYVNLANICKKNKIKLIAMQYPVRSIKPLKQILNNFDEITFVGNEDNFKRALKKYKIEPIFVDRFAGDFGHCTLLGNTLIAQNVAEIILKLYNQ